MKQNKDTEKVIATASKEKKSKSLSTLLEFLKSRQAKRGYIAILLTVIFVVAVVGLNILAVMLTNRVPALSLDLTSNSVYELTDSSVESIDKLDKDITISVLMTEDSLESGGEYYVQVNKLLKAMDQQSKHISLKYVDPSTNPTLTTQYPDINWQSTSTVLLIEYGEKYLGVNYEDIFSYDEEYYSYYGEYQTNGQNVEQAVLTAILNLTTENKVKVALLSGHGEQDMSAFASLLSNNAYDVETLTLLTDTLSADTQFAIIFAPTVDLDEKSYNDISKWLYNDGEYGHTLLYVPNYTLTSETPYIDALLEEWNMAVSKTGLCYETDSTYMADYSYPNLISIYNYAEQEFSANVKNPSIPVVLSFTMPVEILDSGASALLTTTENAVVMPFDLEESWDYKDEEPQTLNGAAISSQGNEDETKSSNVVVIGSYEAFSSYGLSNSAYSNSEFFLSIFNSIAQRDDVSITIESKALYDDQLNIASNGLSIFLGIVMRYILPLAVVVVGIVMFIRRRNK